jgi:acyl-CoA thioesterase FadM
MLIYQSLIVGHVVKAWVGPKIEPSSVFEQRFVAWPWLCDSNLHVNNAQYLTVMDYGRTGWLGATRLVRPLLRDRILLVAGASTTTWRREIRIGQPFTLRTRLVGIEPRWAVFEQTFVRNDGCPATGAFVRVAARHRDGSSASDWLRHRLGADAPGEVEDPAYRDWVASVDCVVDRLRA